MDNAQIFGMMFVTFFLLFIFVGIPMIVLTIIGLYKIFEKAGEEGWKAIIPIYNLIIMIKISGKPWWWIFLMFIPYVGVIWHVWTLNMISKSFGKSEGFTVGLIFLPFVFYMILGLGSDKYLGPYGDPVAFKDFNANKGFDFDRNILNH